MPYPIVERPGRAAAAVPGPQGTAATATCDCTCRCCPHHLIEQHPDAVFGVTAEPGERDHRARAPVYPVVEFPGIEC